MSCEHNAGRQSPRILPPDADNQPDWMIEALNREPVIIGIDLSSQPGISAEFTLPAPQKEGDQ